MQGRALLPDIAETRFSEKSRSFSCLGPRDKSEMLSSNRGWQRNTFPAKFQYIVKFCFFPCSMSQSLLALVNTYIIALRSFYLATRLLPLTNSEIILKAYSFAYHLHLTALPDTKWVFTKGFGVNELTNA